jgi:uroporphyrinogen decarboxylase
MTRKMTSRERVLSAVSHEQPDLVPIDFGGTRASSIVVEGYDRLKKHFGVTSENVLTDRMQRVVDVDEEILNALEIDTRAILQGAPRKKGLAEELAPNKYRDMWGVERVRPEGGYYYDMVASPLAGDITVAEIVRYPWPDPDDPGFTEGVKDRLQWIRENTECAAVLSLPPPFVHTSQYMRGFQDWYMDFILHADVLEALFDVVLEVDMQIAKNLLLEAGQEVDIVFCADDLATQNSAMVSQEHFSKFIKPRLGKYIRQIHDLSPAKVCYHSCGSVVDLMDDLHEIGVDILNPVQVTAKGMDPVELKRRCKGRLAFWGAMDTQNVLPHGNVDDVKYMVEERIEQLGEDGGFVLTAVHNIQPDVPAENIIAMFRHARKYVPSFTK